MKKQNINKLSSLYDENDHLNDAGVSLYVEAQMLDKINRLPKKLRAHVDECASCQMRVVDFHQFMKNEAINPANPHPYLDKKVRQLSFNKYTIGRVAAVALLLITGYFMLFDATGKLRSSANDDFQSSIASPFDNKKIDVGYQEWEVDTKQGKVLKLQNGSNIHVPASAFVNKFGEPIKGKVKIKYREFHNAADIIASGLPMNYDSAGVRYHFESGGMFELRGSQQGKPVFIAEDKSVDVNMVSYNKDTRFNHYFLDEGAPRPNQGIAKAQMLPSLPVFQQSSQPQWKLIGKAVTSPIDSNRKSGESQAQTSDKKTSELKDGPIKPELLKEQTVIAKGSDLTEKNTNNITKDYFELKYALDFEPELKVFKGVKWAYADNLSAYDPKGKESSWVLQEPWHRVTLTKVPFGFKTVAIGGVTNLRYSNDGQRMLAYNQRGRAGLYTKEGKLIKMFDQTISTQMSKSGKYILTTERKAVKLWSNQGKLLLTLPTKNEINMAVISDDDQHILTTNTEEKSHLWTVDGKLVRGFRDSFKFASFSPNSKYIATISDRDYSLKIWTSQGKFLHQLKGEYNTVYFSADSRHLLTSSDKNGAQVWFYETSYNNTMLMNVLRHSQAVKMATFSHDGTKILTASNDGKAKVWSVSGQLLQTLKVSKTWVNSAVFSPDDEMILTGDDYGTAKIWSKGGKLLHILRGHNKGLYGAVFSPNQQEVVTFSKDGNMKVWNRNKPLEEVYALDLSNIGPRYEEVYDLQMKRYLINKRYPSRNPGEEVKRPIRKQLRKFFTMVEMYRPEFDPNTMTAETVVEKLSELKKKYAEELKEVKKELKRQEAIRLEIEKKDRQLAKREAKLFHKFRVRNFGYYNVDRILKMTDADVIVCNADIAIKGSYNNHVRLYLVTGEKSTGVVQFNASELNGFWFQPKHNNQLVVVLPNNQVAIMNAEDFKKIDIEQLRKDRHYVFNLAKVHQVSSPNQLAKLLKVDS